MRTAALMRSPLLALSLSLSSLSTWSGCPIGDNDLLSGMGRACTLDEANCEQELVCTPAPDISADGLCAPVDSFGSCGEATHPPGRLGGLKSTDADNPIKIDEASDFSTFESERVRKVEGQLRVLPSGVGTAEIGALCPLKHLQVVTDGLVIGKTDLTSLDGLQSLTFVGRGMVVFTNSELTDVRALKNLVDVTARSLTVGPVERSFQLVIADNESLPDADVQQLIATLHETTPALEITACGNRGGRACNGDEATLLSLIAAGN